MRWVGHLRTAAAALQTGKINFCKQYSIRVQRSNVTIRLLLVCCNVLCEFVDGSTLHKTTRNDEVCSFRVSRACAMRTGRVRGLAEKKQVHKTTRNNTSRLSRKRHSGLELREPFGRLASSTVLFAKFRGITRETFYDHL